MPSREPFAVTVTLLLFALARQRAGSPSINVELPGPATVADLKREIAAQHPGLAPLVPSMMVAIDNDYVGDDAPVVEGAEIALIPPVSGGLS